MTTCFGPNNNVNPPIWSRAGIYPLDMSYNDFLMKRKVSSLNHTKNSTGLTKSQLYSNVVNGNWTTKRTGFALGAPTICPDKVLCLPASYSGVPGQGFLCSPIAKPIMIQRRPTPASSGGNYTDGYKFI